MSVKVTFDKNAVMMRLKGASEKALDITSQQVLKDSNLFCPKDQSTLIDSSEIHSEPKKGILRWKTPYARALYYGIVMVDPETGSPWAKKGVTKVKSDREYHFDDGRSKMWAHKAQSVHGKEWKQVYQNMFSKEAKKR